MEGLFRKTINHPWVIIVVTVVISVAFMGAIKSRSRMETNLDKYMPQDHPAFVYSDQAESWFGIKDAIIIAIENRDGIYNTGTIRKVKELTQALGKFKEINKKDITSLYTAENIIGTEQGLEVNAFFKKVPESDAALQDLQKAVVSNEMIYGRLVSTDETVTVIIASIEDDVFSQPFYHRILELAKQYEGPEKIHVAGRPIVEGTMAYLGPRDMKRMVPIVILVIVLVLWLVLRSVKSTVVTLLVVLFSTIWAFGLMAALGIPVYAVSTMIPVMLIAIGVADGIHLYSHLHLFLINHPDARKKEAVLDMLTEMWKPVVMTSVTTGVGFISLVTSQVYPIKYFGLFTAFGVMAAMVFSLVLIPAGIMVFGLPRWRKKQTEAAEGKTEFSTLFADKIVRHRYLTLLATVIIIAVSLTGISKVWINSSFLDKFEADSDIVLTDQFINAHFGGTSTLNVIFEGKDKDTFKDPAVLEMIDRLQTDVEKLEVVGNSFALTDYLKRMNKVMHASNPLFDSIPPSRDLIAQYLLLYEMSGDPDNLWKVVDYSYNKANLTIQMKSDNSKTINSAIAVIEGHRQKFAARGIAVHYAGSGYKALIFTDLILEGQIISLLMSLVIVVVLLALMFRSLSLGIIGSIPIVITAAISFGVMGLFNIPLSTTTALVSSIAIGIGIDYAVHFIERYKIYALETGDKTLTIRATMHHSGRAIIFNAVVVIAGFMVLLFSVFPPNRSLGALVSLNMFTSFLGTVTVMFLLLVLSNIFFKHRADGAAVENYSDKAQSGS
ncbi:MMPL family transporter [bacterium]|nr:MMPL family transporter [bacterium]